MFGVLYPRVSVFVREGGGGIWSSENTKGKCGDHVYTIILCPESHRASPPRTLLKRLDSWQLSVCLLPHACMHTSGRMIGVTVRILVCVIICLWTQE